MWILGLIDTQRKDNALVDAFDYQISFNQLSALNGARIDTFLE